MREILFKAKTCNGKWVEGLLANKDNKWYISNKAGQPFAYEVRPDTICQYTGLCDKTGRKIFENDIIRVCTNGFDREIFETKILFGARSGVQGFYLENGRMMFYWGQTDLSKMDDAEFIGNAFD